LGGFGIRENGKKGLEEEGLVRQETSPKRVGEFWRERRKSGGSPVSTRTEELLKTGSTETLAGAGAFVGTKKGGVLKKINPRADTQTSRGVKRGGETLCRQGEGGGKGFGEALL